LKLTALSFDTPRRGGAIAISPPPSGAIERNIWRLRGDVVRSPVCFPRSVLTAQERIKLTIELQSHPAPTGSIWISAEPTGEFSELLGAIEPITIRPERWVGSSAKVTHTFDAARLRQAGVGHERVAWQWFWGHEGSDHATRLARSEHLLFVTLKPPTEPWADDGIAEGAETAPWITALQQACEWGRGAKTERQAAERVVKAVFALGLTQSMKNGRFRYDGDLDHYLDSGLANPRFFNLELFLRHVAQEDPAGPFGINCIEGAAITAAFANLLGCTLDPCVIESPTCEDNFRLNHVRALGYTSGNRDFRFHVVAADRGRLASLGDARIYDITMKVDSDKRPAERPNKFVLTTGMSLGSKRSKPGKAKYFAQLINKASINGVSARRIDHAMVREPDRQDKVEVCPLTRFARHLRELLLAGGPPVIRTPAPMTPTIAGYTGKRIYLRRPGIPRDGLPKVPERTQLLFRDKSQRRQIQIDEWTDPDPWVNLFFMAELLATSEVPPQRLVPGQRIYTFRGNRAILIYREGAVVRLASVGVTQLNMLMVQTQVIWPMKLSTPTRPPASGTNGAARRGPSSRASARVMKPAAKRSRKSPRRRARKR
jgi:hypothetical protein